MKKEKKEKKSKKIGIPSKTFVKNDSDIHKKLTKMGI